MKFRETFRLSMIAVLFVGVHSWALERKISVSGECTLESDPDRGSVILTAEGNSNDPKEAIRAATLQHEKLKTQLKKSKLKTITLSNVEYTVQEVMAWENNQNVSKGFACRIGVRTVTPEIAALGEILSIAAEAGIRNTHALQTYLSDERTLELKKKCLSIAAVNARDKADFLAKSLNSKVGKVLSVLERGTGSPPPPGPVLEGMAMAVRSAPAPTIEGGKQTLHQEVEVTFELIP